MLGDIGHPQLVRTGAAEVPADQVGHRDRLPGPLASRAGGQAGQRGASAGSRCCARP
jgi:hypothetical protein